MSWTTPLTATTGTFTSAQFNASVRDNLNETAPAKATTAGSHFASTGVNSIAERLILQGVVDTLQSSSSTTYTNLPTDGPSVSMTTGIQALVWVTASMSNSTANASTYSTFEVTGATTTVAQDARAAILQNASNNDVRASACSLIPLTPGTNTFREQYRAGSGTSSWLLRRICVMGL